MAQQSVTLQPGESKSVSFEVTPTVAKTYAVAVDGQNGSFRAVAVPVATLSGVVTNASTGALLSGVKVTIAGVSTYTDASGRYGFTNVEPGSYAVTFEKSGYNTLTL